MPLLLFETSEVHDSPAIVVATNALNMLRFGYHWFDRDLDARRVALVQPPNAGASPDSAHCNLRLKTGPKGADYRRPAATLEGCQSFCASTEYFPADKAQAKGQDAGAMEASHAAVRQIHQHQVK
jgi:hypothetical protein